MGAGEGSRSKVRAEEGPPGCDIMTDAAMRPWSRGRGAVGAASMTQLIMGMPPHATDR